MLVSKVDSAVEGVFADNQTVLRSKDNSSETLIIFLTLGSLVLDTLSDLSLVQKISLLQPQIHIGYAFINAFFHNYTSELILTVSKYRSYKFTVSE